MKKQFLTLIALALAVHASADTLDVKTVRYPGPLRLETPFMADSVDVNGNAFDANAIVKQRIAPKSMEKAPWVNGIPGKSAAERQLHRIAFYLENKTFTTAEIKMEGFGEHALFVDGKSSSSKLKLEPATHTVILQYLSEADDSLAKSIKVVCPKDNVLSQRTDGNKIFSLDVNTQGTGFGSLSLSPSGKFLILGTSATDEKGKRSYYEELISLADGKVLSRNSSRRSWMPKSDKLYYTRATTDGRELIMEDPLTNSIEVLVADLPEGYFTIAPTEDYLIYSMEDEGPKEGEVHQILAPDDRQPGWRDRSYISRFDIATGLMQRLTFGYENTYLMDISDDGRYLLFSRSIQRLAKRPTTLTALYRMDLTTMQTECLIDGDGFISSASFSPDGKKLLITGSPECLGGIGNICPEGSTPNMFEYELYLMDMASREVTPLTVDFNPNIMESIWSRYDNTIYIKCEDKDCFNLYKLNPYSKKTERVPNHLDRVGSFDLAQSSAVMVYNTSGLETSDMVYSLNTKNGRQQLVRDFTTQRLENVSMGRGDGYEFTSSRGDLINTFYVLPPDFDPDKKYPMIVHYYGGCSPSTRYAIGSYSPQWYAAQGYVFLVINPSGATGFGQEFSSRHVNTAGQGVAEDIIEAVQRFCADHSYVDTAKIGCFSASYGGFMTQLLLSKTDMFATGISHAGISDHTSYWGEGYWGYSYSEVSMANSYPWTAKDLYVDNSPLYNADKINTPILFLHGSADTNVPIGESIQMFTALRLLGRETAFVVVDGENHGISEYNKKRQWLRTISAWFAKYLKDDDSWWNELYPHNRIAE